ncbi:response regulator transcription factor [Paenibacillus albidus]|uniref:response regulator transcription factor n=1 Tax=Paenibacillus albidus TaxID=2041023 RepID=UPI001E472E27|nr:response regulator transcription factor [Paenibacillus albidus]
MNTEKILLVDDEQGILTLLEITLRKERYHDITSCTTGEQALFYIQNHTYDLILLDVMLGDVNGFELCRDIRKHTDAPIIFITSCASDFDKLTGLGIGGDDYITKPFNPLEVIARIKALFRRQNLTQSSAHGNSGNKEYNYGRFILKPADAVLLVGGQTVECTAKELELLSFFCRNPNRIYTTSQIYELVWGNPGYGDEKTVTIHISKIRKKLNDNPKDPELIINLRGIGYKFVPPVKES